MYNFQHIVLVSKYRFKVFKNPKTQKIVADAFREVEMQFDIKIKECSFGEDYAHVHMEINVPSKLSMEQVVQILKSHSASKVFKEMPNFIKRYPRKGSLQTFSKISGLLSHGWRCRVGFLLIPAGSQIHPCIPVVHLRFQEAIDPCVPLPRIS